MELIRSIPMVLPHDEQLVATVMAFGRIRRDLSVDCFNDGSPLKAIPLQYATYHRVKGQLSAQMTQSAIRSVAAAYQAAKSARRAVKRPFAFRNDIAIFLIGPAGRDASFRRDGTLSIWTVGGRKRLAFRIPERFREGFEQASSYRSITLRMDRRGRITASLTISARFPEKKPGRPVGVDLNETNAVVAVDGQGGTFFETGLATRVLNKRTRKTVRRLQLKLASHKAVHKPTRSVRRVLKRLGRKRANRTKDFACVVAKKLVGWAAFGGPSTLVFERLKFDRRRKKGKALNRRLSLWPHALIKQRVRNRAELVGMPVVEVDPAYTSQLCSACGNLGERKRHAFSCAACGASAHADVNAAANIRARFFSPDFTGVRPGGPQVSRPRSSGRRKATKGKLDANASID